MIHPPYHFFYIESLLTITSSAMNSVDKLNHCIKNINIASHQEIIDNAQNIIIQSAALSRYFWPVQKNNFAKSRGQFLRQQLSITESNVLKNRDVRNFIEHFDEKLDTFCNEIVFGTIIPIFVDIEPTNGNYKFFRAYFIDKGVFKIWGNCFLLQPIVDEIEKLHNLLLAFRKNGSRFNRPLS